MDEESDGSDEEDGSATKKGLTIILSQSRNSVKGSLVLLKWGRGTWSWKALTSRGAFSMNFCEVVDNELDEPE